MSDLDHYYSGDVGTSSAGDLATVDAVDMSVRRVIRRVLTNPGDYIQHPDYGAGAKRYIGVTYAKLPELKSVILNQILQEESVSPNPLPEVTLRADSQTVYVTIKYVEATTGTTQILTFDTNMGAN